MNYTAIQAIVHLLQFLYHLVKIVWRAYRDYRTGKETLTKLETVDVQRLADILNSQNKLRGKNAQIIVNDDGSFSVVTKSQRRLKEDKQ